MSRHGRTAFRIRAAKIPSTYRACPRWSTRRNPRSDALHRERISDLDRIFLTHWHPDHVNGLRVVQARDATAHENYIDGVLDSAPTIVTTRAVYERTCDVFGQLEHYVDQSFVDVRFLDEEPLRIGDDLFNVVPELIEEF